LYKARELPKEDFRRAVEKELTGKETEPPELIYFKVYKSLIPAIEQAIDTAALMLGHGQILRLLSGDDLHRPSSVRTWTMATRRSGSTRSHATTGSCRIRRGKRSWPQVERSVWIFT
jgi:hypothetical protein